MAQNITDGRSDAEREPMTDQPRAWLGSIGGAIALADAMTYLGLILRQGDSSPIVPWVFSLIVAGAIAALFGSLSNHRAARTALLAAATLFLVLGLIGIFSIGLPLLVSSALCFTGAAQTSKPRRERSGLRRGILVGGLVVALVGTVFFFAQMFTGAVTVGVSCRPSTQGAGIPSVAGAHPRSTDHPRPCRTIVSH